MKIRTVIAIAVLCAAVAFLAGAWVSYESRPRSTTASRKILYYVDPMHPSYRSDRPGIAPDCGMPLEPVYADGAGRPTSTAQSPPGTVQVAPEKLQSIRVRVSEVARVGGSQLLRVSGRIVPDERRVYRLTASVDGWVQQIGAATTGSMVKKHETLLSYYSPDFLAAIQAYIFALGSRDRIQAYKGQGQDTANPLEATNLSLRSYRNTLRNLGMSDLQMDEIARSREPTENVRMLAPATGLVLSRNVYPGLKFERGAEFFRIADLSRVWVLADTYGSEADHLKPGTRVKVSVPNRNLVFWATVSSVPPIFDPQSRTLKARLELDNPGSVLRPDMFVDVELPVSARSMLAVPTEAVFDTGLKKQVFVERGPGVFEPREVETGRTVGAETEIVAGLKEGERVAVSGTFMLDSESRMKTAAAGISSTARVDPVCGMYVDEKKARDGGLSLELQGASYFFCCREDLEKFRKEPARFLSKASAAGSGMSHQGTSSLEMSRETMDSAEAQHKSASPKEMTHKKTTPKDMSGGKPQMANHGGKGHGETNHD